MDWIFLLIAFVIIAAALAVGMRWGSRSEKVTPETDRSPYQSRRYLFTQTERYFLGILDQFIDNRYRKFGKVRLADIIQPQRELSRDKWHGAFNRIKSRRLDFVICKASDLSIVGVVEIDDRAHDTLKRKDRNEFVDKVLQDAGIPVLRLPAKRGYVIGEIREAVTKKLGIEVLDTTKETTIRKT
ncbi:MAG TPA: DUF2726 domain-containing protein [Thermodesulfobacteriota bacterium]|nr:DUF2726 domain-containing protein [Thermodesulfobacteriota bacterium]